MRRMRSWGIVAVVAVAALGSSQAEEVWIAAEPAVPEPGQEIRVKLMQGEPFAGTERGFEKNKVAAFQRVWRSGRSHLSGEEGGKPVATFTAADPGVQLIAYSEKPERAGSEPVSRFCKAFVVVGKGQRESPLRYSEMGQRLEIVPQTDPVALLARGGRVELQVLFEREPLAAVAVRAFPASAPKEGFKRALTDEIGLATLRLDRPGTWMIQVAHRARCEDDCSGSRWERLQSTLVIHAGG